MTETKEELQNNELIEENGYNPLDMSNYHLNKLPKRERSKFERIMIYAGAPIAVLVFIVLNFFAKLDFLHHIDPSTLSEKALNVYNSIGPEAFTATNISMLAIFLAAVILWITEAIPNYLTSLILIIALVLTNVLSEVDAYHQLGHKVMWLNILSFVLASMLVKTGVAKRFALWFILKFGKNASSIFISFIVINLILSAFISATTAKAAILLPIFMVVSAVYGATGGKKKNNFGRNIVLQNLLQINMGAGAFVTGSGANLLAAALIGGAIGSDIFFTDWMTVAFPISLAIMIIGFFVGTKLIFPLKKEERVPQIKGGMEKLRKELSLMGKVSFEEIRSVIIFVSVLALWTTDKYHGISPTAVAFLGAVIALLPRIGVVKWNEVDIPWHLLLFSAGAYTLGAGFKVTDLPSISVNAIFDGLGFNESTPFGVLYLILTFTMLFSALIFQSKTMRTLIFVPIAIGVAQKFGYPVLSLAFPVALLIEHVYVLPFNSKPALLLYSTDQYTWSDTFKYGITMMTITWFLFMILGETWLRALGYTQNGIFGIF